MKLPGFLSQFTQDKSKKDYLFALEIGTEYISVAVWHVVKDKVDIVGTGQSAYKGGWDEVISSADTALAAACGEMPNAEKITKVILGLPPQYVDGDRIVSQYLAEFKRLCKELTLNPVGFVVIPEAIAYLLGKEDGVAQTAILAGIEKTTLTVSVFKVGKSLGVATQQRSEHITLDFEQALTTFSNIEVLPTKIILYGPAVSERLRDELLNYPWKSKASFLHFPKMDILTPETTIEAVAVAGAAELAAPTFAASPVESEKILEEVAPAVPEEPVETAKTAVVPVVSETVEQPETFAEPVVTEQPVNTFGFVRDRDIALEKKETVPPAFATSTPETAVSKPRSLPLKMPAISLPHFSLPHMPLHGVRIALVLAILMLVLLGGIGVSLYWTVPTATVKLIVDPRVAAKEFEVKLDTGASESDIEGKKIPASVVNLDLDAQESAPATGKKIVGDAAKGTVTIYNKTTNEKTFAKGSVVNGPKNLQFTLDAEVTVASVSDVFAGIAGKGLGKVTASAIGTDGNLPPSSDFAFKDFPVTLYAARNDQAFAGGTSREVQVVAKTDVDTLVKKMSDRLTQEAREKISQKLEPGAELLPESIQVSVAKRVLSSEVGSEAKDVNVSLSVKATGTSYRKSDIENLVRRDMESLTPANFMLDTQDPEIRVSSANVARDGSVTFKASIRSKLIPIVAKEDVKKKLVGQALSEVESILRKTEGIVGFEVVFTKEFPFAQKTLPKLAKNLTVEVQPR